MVEIEIGVMVAQCLDRRIPTKAMLIRQVRAWESARNSTGARIKWLFTDRAREKLGRAYLSVRPKPATPAAGDHSHNHCAEVLAPPGPHDDTVWLCATFQINR